MTIDQLEAAALALPETDRERLAHRLIAGLSMDALQAWEEEGDGLDAADDTGDWISPEDWFDQSAL